MGDGLRNCERVENCDDKNGIINPFSQDTSRGWVISKKSSEGSVLLVVALVVRWEQDVLPWSECESKIGLFNTPICPWIYHPHKA